MKKKWVALITFGIGILAFNFLSLNDFYNVETQDYNLNEIPVSKVTSSPENSMQLEFPQRSKLENNLPFFKSFKDDEGYSCWLIADDFKGMKEVWTVLLSRNSENSKSEKLVWDAIVLTTLKNGDPNDDADFSSVSIKAENNKLSFKTNKYRNVEYKFNGEFLKNWKDFANDENVLKGTMQKFVKGKKVAEFTSNFVYYQPHCYH